MNNRPWFIDWFNSPYYHLLYYKRDEKEASGFIDKLIQHLSPPENARILDVACGRGRFSFCLSRQGFDVTGIDLSESSIKEALKYETDKLHFYRHDMRNLFWINYFDYAFNFFTSFGYFRTQREHDNSIRTIALSLKNNGFFVLDYLNVHHEENNLEPQSTKQIDGTTFSITKWEDETHFYKKIIIQNEQLKEPLEFTEEVAKFSLDDFTEMFHRQNLQIQEVFGDYSLGEYDTIKSPRLIIIAKKNIL
jgi:2-polyprenyl-3-methyl-5-hydroxy-6-metoxy-1,4-benzoquinol methylase